MRHHVGISTEISSLPVSWDAWPHAPAPVDPSSASSPPPLRLFRGRRSFLGGHVLCRDLASLSAVKRLAQLLQVFPKFWRHPLDDYIVTVEMSDRKSTRLNSS